MVKNVGEEEWFRVLLRGGEEVRVNAEERWEVLRALRERREFVELEGRGVVFARNEVRRVEACGARRGRRKWRYVMRNAWREAEVEGVRRVVERVRVVEGGRGRERVVEEYLVYWDEGGREVRVVKE